MQARIVQRGDALAPGDFALYNLAIRGALQFTMLNEARTACVGNCRRIASTALTHCSVR